MLCWLVRGLAAIHSIVFGGFSPDALASRITDCTASLLITADEGPRGGKNVAVKEKTLTRRLKICGDIPTLVVAPHGRG